MLLNGHTDSRRNHDVPYQNRHVFIEISNVMFCIICGNKPIIFSCLKHIIKYKAVHMVSELSLFSTDLRLYLHDVKTHKNKQSLFSSYMYL